MVFVTGGSGLVGQWLISELLRRGERVRASYREQPPTILPAAADPKAVEWVEGDILDPLFLQEAVSGAAVVYHCAAVVSYAPRDAERLWEVNVRGTANVVDALLSVSPTTRLVHVSSVAALGSNPDGNPLISEQAQWDADENHSAYAESKYAAELEVWRGVSEGLAAVIVNPAVIVGPADPGRSSTQLFRYAAGRHRYYPPGQLNVVDVRDVVAAMLALAPRPDLHGQRYTLSAGAVSYADFFRFAADELGNVPPTQPIPGWLAEILWRAEKARGWLTGAAPLLTKETARLSRRAVVFDATRIRQKLDFRFRSPEEAIRWSARELRSVLGAAH